MPSRCLKGSMRRAAAPMSIVRTGLHSMPDPQSSRLRFCWKSCGASAGANWRTMSSCGRPRRSTASVFMTAPSSTIPATPRPCGLRWRNSPLAMLPVTTGSWRPARRSSRSASNGWAMLPSTRSPDMVRILPQIVRLGCYRTVYGLVAKKLRDPRLRTVFSFHPLLIGGNPFSATAIYTLIGFLGAPLGRSFRDGRHGPCPSRGWSA